MKHRKKDSQQPVAVYADTKFLGFAGHCVCEWEGEPTNSQAARADLSNHVWAANRKEKAS